MKLNFRELEVIRAVLDEGTMSSASRKLHVTQPAVSMMLKQAEARMRFRLFERQGHRLVATKLLKELTPLLDSLFTQLTDLSTRVEQLQQGDISSLHVATTTAWCEAFATSALRDFQRSFPRIKATLESLTNDAIVKGVDHGRFDLGITVSKSTLPGISARSLGTTDIVCVMRNDDALCAKDTITAADLVDRRIISYRADGVFGMRLASCFEAQGYPFRPAVGTNALNAASLVAQGAGIGLLEALVVKSRRDPRLTVRPFTPRISTELYLIKSAAAHNSPIEHFELALLKAMEALNEAEVDGTAMEAERYAIL